MTSCRRWRWREARPDPGPTRPSALELGAALQSRATPTRPPRREAGPAWSEAPGPGRSAAELYRHEGAMQMAEVGIKELLEAGVHFGHQTRRWNPNMRRY